MRTGVLIFLLIIFSQSELSARQVIPSGKEEYFKNLPSPYNKYFGEYILKDIIIDEDMVRYSYCNTVDCFFIILSKEKTEDILCGRSRNFFISYAGKITVSDIKPIVDAILKNDTGDIFISVSNPSPFFKHDTKHDTDFIRITYILITLILILLIISRINGLKIFCYRILLSIEQMHGLLYFLIFVLVVVYASYLRLRCIYLPVFEEGSALRLLYSYGNPLYNIFYSYDPRHPGLYFAILNPFLKFSENPAFIARIISALFSIVSVGFIGLIVREKSKIFSLIAMLLLATNPEYVYRSREITDLSLFVMNSLLSIFFLRRAISENKKIDYYLTFLFLLLSCFSSYAAYINLAAIFVYLYIHKKIKVLIKPIIILFLCLSPFLYKILSSLSAEFYSRKMAKVFPDIIWGEKPIYDFVQQTLFNLFGGEHYIIIFGLLIIYLVLNFKILKEESFPVILFISNLLFVLFSLYFRMMPYYLIFSVVSFILLMLSIKIEKQEYTLQYLFVLIFSLFTLYAFIKDSNNRFESTYIQSYHQRTNPGIIIDTIKKSEIKDIVIDIENNKNILGYYFFDKPYKVLAENGCKMIKDNMMECFEEDTSKRITVLTRTMSIRSDWREKSLSKLKSINYTDYFFIYDKNYKNEYVLDYIDSHCRPILLGEKYLLYRCRREE